MTTTMSKKIPLKFPLPYGDGNELRELQFRRPMAGDLRGLKLGGLSDLDVDLFVTIASRMSTVHVTVGQLHQLDPADFVAVATEIAGFFGDADQSPTTQTVHGES